MIWCLDYICLVVEVWGLSNLSKEGIARAPNMCAFGVQLQPWHWKYLRRDKVIEHLAGDLKYGRRTQMVAKSGNKWATLVSCRAGWVQHHGGAPQDGVCMAVGRKPQELLPGFGKCCAPKPGVNPAPGWSHLKLTWTSLTMQWTSYTPTRHLEQKWLDVKHHCLSHLHCYDKKNLHLQI